MLVRAQVCFRCQINAMTHKSMAIFVTWFHSEHSFLQDPSLIETSGWDSRNPVHLPNAFLYTCGPFPNVLVESFLLNQMLLQGSSPEKEKTEIGAKNQIPIMGQVPESAKTNRLVQQNSTNQAKMKIKINVLHAYSGFVNATLKRTLFSPLTDLADGHQALLWAVCDAMHWIWLIYSYNHWRTHSIQTGDPTNQEEIQNEILAPYKSGIYSSIKSFKEMGYLDYIWLPAEIDVNAGSFKSNFSRTEARLGQCS